MLSKIKISETLFVASIPAIGYVAAYFYQLGVYSFFKIPSMFVRIGVEDVIFSTAITTLFIVLISFIAYVVFTVPSKGNTEVINKPKKQDLFVAIAVLLITLPLLGFFIISSNLLLTYKIVILIGTIIIIPIIVFIPPLFKFPNEKSYAKKYLMYNRYLYQEKITKIKDSEGVSKTFSFSPNFPYTNYILSFAFILIWGLSAFILGSLSYTDTTKYLTYQHDNSKYIVAGTYFDHLLMIKLDENLRITSKETLFVPLGYNIKFELEEIGKINQK